MPYLTPEQAPYPELQPLFDAMRSLQLRARTTRDIATGFKDMEYLWFRASQFMGHDDVHISDTPGKIVGLACSGEFQCELYELLNMREDGADDILDYCRVGMTLTYKTDKSICIGSLLARVFELGVYLNISYAKDDYATNTKFITFLPTHWPIVAAYHMYAMHEAGEFAHPSVDKLFSTSYATIDKTVIKAMLDADLFTGPNLLCDYLLSNISPSHHMDYAAKLPDEYKPLDR